MSASNFGATPAGGVYDDPPKKVRVYDDYKADEALQMADTSLTFPLCPHCGGELALMFQTKVWLAEETPEESI